MKRHIPNELLELFENWFTNGYSCIKWADVWLDIFRVSSGVRQGSVLSPILFAIYLDDLAVNSQLHSGTFLLLYADDILLLAPSITKLEKLLHACEEKLTWLDMKINVRISCCLRIGPINHVNCAEVWHCLVSLFRGLA